MLLKCDSSCKFPSWLMNPVFRKGSSSRFGTGGGGGGSDKRAGAKWVLRPFFLRQMLRNVSHIRLIPYSLSQSHNRFQ